MMIFAATTLLGCDDDKTPQKAPTPSPGRFAAVAKKPAAAATKGAAEAAGRFCEKTYPATGPGSRTYTAAPVRTLPVAPEGQADAKRAAAAWTWVNVWATWCAPCIDEMALLGRWSKGLQTAGTPLHLELLSVDAPDAADALAKVIKMGLPGRTSWIKSPEDVEPFMKALGVDAGAALPVHALVDPTGALRCVRVGAIHDRDYGAVKALLAGG